MPFESLLFLWSYQYTLRGIFDLVFEQCDLEEAERKGQERVAEKMKEYEEWVAQELEKEKRMVERAFKQSEERGQTEEKEDKMIVALARASSYGRGSDEGPRVKGRDKSEGERRRIAKRPPEASTSTQGTRNSLMATLSSWFSDPKEKTE